MGNKPRNGDDEVAALQALIEQGQRLTTGTLSYELARWRALSLSVLASLGALDGAAADAPRTDWVPAGKEPDHELARGWGVVLGALQGELFRRTGRFSTVVPAQSPPRSLVSLENERPLENGLSDSTEGAVSIQVLGPVEIANPKGNVEPNRRNSLTELACWIYFRLGSDHKELDQALRPAGQADKNTRNAQCSRPRAWLGADAFPRVGRERGYRLSEALTSDWSKFQNHCQAAADREESEAEHLQAALELVRGRPFADAQKGRYLWAAQTAQAMAKRAVDAVLRLAVLREQQDVVSENPFWPLKQGFRALGYANQALKEQAAAYGSDPWAVHEALRAECRTMPG
ncbi:hypothetical protein [Streptomyces sp. NPDC014734]|uniref:hypothetical protein n=1 Tax=Streptomyces sp. NPDC014734 TaxID=3364886 RepID=UPI0037032E99